MSGPRGIYVYLGPTLPRADAASILDARYLPPVAGGDVQRLLSRRPAMIGIVDRLFEQQAAVLHKELLYALSLGVRVFGASSMGALRAAELDAFGMEGVIPVALARAGELSSVVDQVERTWQWLAREGLELATLDDAGLTADQLMAWYRSRSGSAATAAADESCRLGMGEQEFTLELLRQVLFERKRRGGHER